MVRWSAASYVVSCYRRKIVEKLWNGPKRLWGALPNSAFCVISPFHYLWAVYHPVNDRKLLVMDRHLVRWNGSHVLWNAAWMLTSFTSFAAICKFFAVFLVFTYLSVLWIHLWTGCNVLGFLLKLIGQLKSVSHVQKKILVIHTHVCSYLHVISLGRFTRKCWLWAPLRKGR